MPEEKYLPFRILQLFAKKEYIVIAIDSSGIKVANRGQWMRDKWHTSKNNKKVFENTYSS
ncbi:MAG TPA: hypothetical protein VIY08_16585 [Candidatus Nitrosocosmicus sp.]